MKQDTHRGFRVQKARMDPSLAAMVAKVTCPKCSMSYLYMLGVGGFWCLAGCFFGGSND